jgi:hypothetical protein
MEDVILRARGVNSEVELLEGVVRIRRRSVFGFFAQAGKFEKDILISEMSSIQFKKAGILADGYIQFTFAHAGSSGTADLRRDENTVIFHGGQQKAFEALRQALEESIASRRRGSGSRASTDLDELEKLASLRDKGVLSEEEFSRKKRQILGL